MKKLAISAFLVVVLTMVLAVPAMAAAPTVHKVTGGGGILIGPDEIFVNYAFTAKEAGGCGMARGEFLVQARNIEADIRLKADILYLAVNGNEAWIGGVITQSNADGIAAGDSIVIKVVDNGQGSKATGPDRISSMHFGFGPEYALSMPFMPAHFDFVKGDIQVS